MFGQGTADFFAMEVRVVTSIRINGLVISRHGYFLVEYLLLIELFPIVFFFSLVIVMGGTKKFTKYLAFIIKK